MPVTPPKRLLRCHDYALRAPALAACAMILRMCRRYVKTTASANIPDCSTITLCYLRLPILVLPPPIRFRCRRYAAGPPRDIDIILPPHADLLLLPPLRRVLQTERAASMRAAARAARHINYCFMRAMMRAIDVDAAF